ncbi:hypothetical protein [Mesorhizobium sp. SP-1A]|uniref:hypothetical protein n=1 Tax=Mesorhizobium sp. SP-1A TaxID=3077840 RepID=UPI0028F7023E|nr:hypothetical protein [Mesorhizobium sp. SP-1A]
MTDFVYNYNRENPVTLWDALNGWSEGALTWEQAIRIGGLDDRYELIATATLHGVPIPVELTDDDRVRVDEFIRVIRAEESDE